METNHVAFNRHYQWRKIEANANASRLGKSRKYHGTVSNQLTDV
jgi:hypothetical protein